MWRDHHRPLPDVDSTFEMLRNPDWIGLHRRREGEPPRARTYFSAAS